MNVMTAVTIHPHRRPRILVLAALLMSAIAIISMGCQGTDVLWQGRPIVEEGPQHTAVRDRLDAYYKDFSARDWVAFASHFWDGATITTILKSTGEGAGSVVSSSVPAFVEQAPLGPGSKEIFAERMKSAEVQVDGNIAVAWVDYEAEFGDRGNVQRWEGVDVVTLMNHGGVWKIVSLAFQAAR